MSSQSTSCVDINLIIIQYFTLNTQYFPPCVVSVQFSVGVVYIEFVVKTLFQASYVIYIDLVFLNLFSSHVLSIFFYSAVYC